MTSVVSLQAFKGRKALKEYFKGFIVCPKCRGLIHWDGSPHLTPEQLREAITFPRYILAGGDVYYLNERAMIEFARMKGIVL